MILGNDTVTVLKRTPSGQSSVGTPTVTSVSTSVPGCSFQPSRTTETISDVDLTVSYWTLYAPIVPAITALTPLDAIEVNGVVFEDFGDPQVWTDRLGRPVHVTITVRKARG